MAEQSEPTMRPARERSRSRLFATPLPALLLLAVLALGSGSVAAIRETAKPGFCTSCHEMTPYHAAWSDGTHKGVSCVSCHVDPGVTAEVTHKFVALKEVYDHFTSSPTFPRGDADVPDSRCLACHTDLPAVTKSGFLHAQHAKQGACVDCHRSVGHKVAPEALQAAGVFATPTVSPSSAETSGTHVTVDCSRCHDLTKTACSTCHTPNHAPRGACTTCHVAGTAWTFAHPAATSSCTTCHERPKRHFAGACTTCHDSKTPFAKTVYKHTDPSCTTCHAQPAGHRATGSTACTVCHPKKGVSWAFAHPSSSGCAGCHSAPGGHFGSDCAGCHSVKVPFAQTRFTHTSTACADCHHKPSGHFTGRCAGCHSPSVPFAATKWRHPVSTTCASCHSRPSGHDSGTCYTCHKQPGRSWAFSHPSSTSCSNCHHAPSSHFGTNCASCHKVGRAWSSATFSHPSIPGGEHTYRSFACSNCHPVGPPKVGCTCHGGGTTGPKGD